MCKEQQFQEPKKQDWTVEILVCFSQEYNTKPTERYQSRYNDNARFRASAALGDVLERVARRAGIVVILNQVGKQSGFQTPSLD
jgi:hypothetical protein